ncbi:MAG: 2-hydroxyacyl-CoA dehydratase [Deltaproteobacteria bacterium]|nr:2-hydroxyacyl-CoA dehydratase [Deltaproteobacteria bacterium]
MMPEYIENLVNGIEHSFNSDPAVSTPRKLYELEFVKLGRRLYRNEGRVAWCGVMAPFDLLRAMDVTSCFVEFLGAILATAGVAGPMLQAAELAGFTGDTCAYHRAVIGAAMQGLTPEPDFLIGTTCPCTGGLAALENLAEIFKKDLFILNIPLNDTRDNIRYLADQFKAMLEFITQKTGRMIDGDRLREVVENSNRVGAVMRQVYDLAKNVPSPITSRDLSSFGIAMPLLFGTEAAITVAEGFRKEFAARIGRAQSGVKNEQFRLLWLQNRIMFPNPLEKLLEEEYRAVIVVDEYNSINWEPIDPADPITGMARRTMSDPLNGSATRRVEHLRKAAIEYQVHGAINPCHWGCRQGTGIRGLISEGLKEIGIPVLNLELDCVDSRNFAEGQMKTRVEAFIEMLDSRRSH